MTKMTAEQLKLWSDENDLRAGVRLEVQLVGEQLAARLFVQSPEGPPSGRLVWQHRRPCPDKTTEAIRICADAMFASARYLESGEFYPVQSD